MQYAKMDEVKVTRLLRSDNGMSRQVFVLNLVDLEKVPEADLIIPPGDTIEIDHTGWLTVGDLFAVFSTAAIVTTAIVQVINASK